MKKVTVFIGAFILLGILLTMRMLLVTTAQDGTEPTPMHTHSYASEIVPATCAYGGFTLFFCECGDSYQNSETPALDHEYSDWTVVQTATTYNDGQTERHCLHCNEKEIEIIPKLEEHMHTYSDEVVAPTCTEGGFTLHTCTTCGYKTSDNLVSAKGHAWGSWKTTKEATQNNTGKKERVCSTCNKTESQTIPKVTTTSHTHAYTEKVVAPTCSADGYTLHTCSCGKSYETDAVPALGHLYGDWTTTQQATADSTGEKKCTCTRCGHTKTESVPKLDPVTAEKYEQYIDSRIEITAYGNGAVGYYYSGLGVVDTRSWGVSPTIKITADSNFQITYFKQDGTKVEFTLAPKSGYVRRCVILEDGTFNVHLIGDFKD